MIGWQYMSVAWNSSGVTVVPSENLDRGWLAAKFPQAIVSLHGRNWPNVSDALWITKLGKADSLVALAIVQHLGSLGWEATFTGTFFPDTGPEVGRAWLKRPLGKP